MRTEADLLLARQDPDRLGKLHDRFKRGDVQSYVVVAVSVDGTAEVNFDLHATNDRQVMNKIGGGLIAALNHMRELSKEAYAREMIEKRGAGHA